jgi:hypothetical protein
MDDDCSDSCFLEDPHDWQSTTCWESQRNTEIRNADTRGTQTCASTRHHRRLPACHSIEVPSPLSPLFEREAGPSL